MKKNFRFLAMAVVAMAAAVFTGCSSDDDFLAPYEESAIQTRAISSTNALIDFDNVPSSVMASDQYGNNLYSATANGKQVTTGYICLLYTSDAADSLGNMNFGMVVLPSLISII